jgi:hypothetical protein
MTLKIDTKMIKYGGIAFSIMLLSSGIIYYFKKKDPDVQKLMKKYNLTEEEAEKQLAMEKDFATGDRSSSSDSDVSLYSDNSIENNSPRSSTNSTLSDFFVGGSKNTIKRKKNVKKKKLSKRKKCK